MSDKTFSPEIKKLMDKMAENPESRLFVPLAEEYLKSDMPDEAILVLVDGIGRHPTYVSARIMLGKIYLEKKRIMEAKSEFERVIEINPENILAHKKLALIYQEAGQPQRAIDAYQKILAVDPSDKEIKALLAKLVEEDPSTVVSDDHAPQQDSESASEPGAIHFVPTSEEVFGTTPDDVSPGTGADLDEEEAPHIELGSGIAETRPDEDLEAKDEKIFDLTEEWKSQDNIIQKDAITDDETPDAPSQIAEPISEAEPNETLATNALASLYMDQGCYQEAADVYKERLALDPTDQESREGLEQALKKLAERTPGEEASLASAVEHEKRSSPKSNRERLKLWLDAIQKDRRQ